MLLAKLSYGAESVICTLISSVPRGDPLGGIELGLLLVITHCFGWLLSQLRGPGVPEIE